MIRCDECEFFRRGPDGSPHLACDPFGTIKEPECLVKWQLMKLDSIAQAHEATLAMHRRFAPLQEKMFKYMEREIDEANESEKWRVDDDDDDDDDVFGV